MTERKPLSPVDLFEFVALGDPRLSPDGEWVAFVRRQADDRKDAYRSEIWGVPTAGGEPRRLTGGPDDSSPRWSPDGRCLAFLGRRDDKTRIRILPFRDGGESWTLATDHEPASAPLWAPDGRRIAFTAQMFTRPEDWRPYPGSPEGDRRRAERQADPDKQKDGEEAEGRKKGENRTGDGPEAEAAAGKDGPDPVKLIEKGDVRVVTDMYYRHDGRGLLGDRKSETFLVDVVRPGDDGFDDPPERRLTRADFHHSDPAWSPDGRHLAFVAFREERRFETRYRHDLYVMDVEMGNERLVLRADGPVTAPAWSPDGRSIAYVGHHSRHDLSTTDGVWLVDVARFVSGGACEPLGPGDTRCLTEGLERPVGAGMHTDLGAASGSPLLFWSADGRCLWFIAATEGTARLYRTRLGGADDTDGVDATEADGAVGTARTGSVGIDEVYCPDLGGLDSLSLDAASGRAAVRLVTPLSPGEIAVLDLKDGSRGGSPGGGSGPEPRRLTALNKDLLGRRRLGSSCRFRYAAADGLGLDGWLLLPAGEMRTVEDGAPVALDLGRVGSAADLRRAVGRSGPNRPAPGSSSGNASPYPTILFVHGGPHGMYGDMFLFQMQLFASNGYAVLYTNPRGSAGYGDDFALRVIEDWGGGDYEDIMAAVDLAVEAGIADPDRLGVTGWSYGGYMTNWIITHTGRFRAAVAGASLCNMLSDYGNTDFGIGFDGHNFGGLPWREPERFLDHSPLMYVDNVTTPVLLLHGEDDIRCHITQAEEFYTALKRLGKEACMVRYPGEFHGFKKPRHAFDRLTRMLAWFDHRLRESLDKQESKPYGGSRQ